MVIEILKYCDPREIMMCPSQKNTVPHELTMENRSNRLITADKTDPAI